MADKAATDPVLLVPGLFSPRWLMWPLERSLRKAGFRAEIWDEASVFGRLETSIARLRQRLDRLIEAGSCGVVTHSFGDWLVRKVIADECPEAVASLVSLAPVMSASVAAKAVAPLGAVAPEIDVLADARRASEALVLPDSIRRLVVWPTIDPWVQRVTELPGAEQHVVVGTHNSIVFQPGLHRLVIDHLRGREAAA